MTQKKAKTIIKTPSIKQNIPSKKIIYLLLGIIVVIVFWNCLLNDWAFDDNSYIIGNKYLTDITNIPKHFFTNYTEGGDRNIGLYRPLPNVINTIIISFFGLSPWLFHFVNILFHFLTVIVIYKLISMLTDKPIIGVGGAILFAVATIHSEPVNNCANLSEILAAYFSLLTFYIFITWQKFHSEKHSAKTIIFLFLCSFCAMISKESGITFIGFILAFDLIFNFSKTSKFKDNLKTFFKKRINIYFVFFTSILLYLILRYIAIGSGTIKVGSFMDNPLLIDSSITGIENFLTALTLIPNYLFLSIAPFNLSCDYSFNQFPIIGSFTNIEAVLGLAIILLVLFLIIFYLKKNKLLSLSLLFICMTYSIASNIFINIGTIFSERLVYLPTFGLYFLIALLIYGLIQHIIKGKSQKVINGIYYSIITCLALYFGIFTFLRNFDWKNDQILMNKDLNTAPNSTKLYQFLMQDYIGLSFNMIDTPNNANKGITLAKYSIMTWPENQASIYGMGCFNLALNKTDDAVLWFAKTLAMAGKSGFTRYEVDAILYMGIAYRRGNKLEEAKIWLNKILSMQSDKDPRLPGLQSSALEEMGIITVSEKNIPKAIDYFQKSMVNSQNKAKIYYYMALSYKEINDINNMRTCLLKSLELNPNFGPSKELLNLIK